VKKGGESGGEKGGGEHNGEKYSQKARHGDRSGRGGFGVRIKPVGSEGKFTATPRIWGPGPTIKRMESRGIHKKKSVTLDAASKSLIKTIQSP